MTRRAILSALIAAGPASPAKPDDGRVPTDVFALNEFAELYNAYVLTLNRGQLDLKAWRRVRRAWRDMTE